jgi:RNA polymerase-binding transcription factor DksA
MEAPLINNALARRFFARLNPQSDTTMAAKKAAKKAPTPVSKKSTKAKPVAVPAKKSSPKPATSIKKAVKIAVKKPAVAPKKTVKAAAKKMVKAPAKKVVSAAKKVVKVAKNKVAVPKKASLPVKKAVKAPVVKKSTNSAAASRGVASKKVSAEVSKSSGKKASAISSSVKNQPASAVTSKKPQVVQQPPEQVKSQAVATTAKKKFTPPQAKNVAQPETIIVKPITDPKFLAFTQKQKQRLLDLRDEIVDAMTGSAREAIRSSPEGSEASGSGMHQGDAGSDAYDRDFALSVLAKDQDALYEIEEALLRIKKGTYGLCEMSGKPIPIPRLEAIPFARLTVDCQAQWEKEFGTKKFRPSGSIGFSGGGIFDEDEDSDTISLDEDED